MNRFLIIVGGLMVGLLAALFVVPVFVDWTRYRGVFEEEATRLLGRDVRVGGKVNLRLLPSPYIRFEKVRVADTKAAVGEPLFKADDFTVWLSVSPLLRGDIEASVIELHKPVLTLVLDDKGGGNWTSLAEPAIKGSFAPGKIAFDNVRINNGTIAIYGANGEERTRFEHINGEFSSPAIDGPYKFAAAFAHAGAPREIRLSTARPDPDGAIRLKGSVRAPASGVSYALDGKVMDLFLQPRLQGEITAKLPLPSFDGAAPAGAGPAAPARGTGDASFDLKSSLKADASGAEFSDVTLSFDQDGQPQLVTGEARVVWRDRVAANVKLQSRWLDLDRIAGRESKTSLPHQLERLAKGLDTVLPLTGQTRLGFNLDQATLGGDVASGLTLVAERKDGQLEIEAGATVPGGSRFEAKGIVSAARSDRLFEGNVSLRGASAGRFLAWSGRNTPLPPIKRDGPFAISGMVTLGADRVAGRELVLQFPGNNLTGDASWATDGSGRQIVLALQSEELDLSPFVPEDQAPLTAVRTIAAKLAALGASAGTAATPAPTIVARLRIGQLIAGRTALRDVTTDVRFAGGNLSFPLLQISSNGGWTLEVRGDIADLAKPGAKGNVTFSFGAETAQGLQELLAAGELGDAWILSPRRAAALVPLHMAGRLRVGEAGAGIYETAFDGNLGPTRTSGSARFDPAGESWRDGRADVALTLDGGDVGRLMEQIAPETWNPTGSPTGSPIGAATAQARPPGRIVLRGIGTPKAGLVSLANVETAGFAAEYRGRLRVTDNAQLGVEGDLRFAVTDLAQTLALAGIRDRTSLVAQSVAGVIAVSGSPERLQLAASRLDLGGTSVSGRLEYEARAGSPRLTGRLSTNTLNLPAMLGLLTVPRGVQRNAVPAAGASTSSPAAPSVMGPPRPPQATVWGEDPFELSPWGAIESQLRIETEQFTIAPDVSLGKSVIEFDAKAGRLGIRLTDATSLGGKLTGALYLERATAGVMAKATLRLADARLEAVTVPGSKPASTGPLALSLDLDGTALNPRNLVAALQGKGELSIGQGRIDRLAPRGIAEVAEAMLSIKGEPPPGELGRRLSAALAGGTVPIGRRTVALEAKDGAIRVAPLTLETPEGRLTATTSFDLEALRFDSEWRIEPKAQPKSEVAKTEVAKTDPAAPAVKPKVPLPGVIAIYTGALSQLGIVDPRLQFDALEREIAVRKVERDLDELERIRKLDEERSRLEAERRAEAAAAAAPATQVPSPSGPATATPAWPPPTTIPAPLAPVVPSQPVAAPPALIETPSPAVRPPAALDGTSNGTLGPLSSPTPSGNEPPPPPSPGSAPAPVSAPAPSIELNPSKPPPAANPDTARRAQPRPEPEPKPARKDVFGEQGRTAN